MQSAKVLVVEDDVHLLEGIRDILELEEEMKFEVLMAENGVHALEVLRSQVTPPDLIVSDIMMPKMDGITFLKEVRKEPIWFAIPFIFLTAKGEKSDQHRGLRLGVDDYIVKPYDPNDLLEKIKARLRRYSGLNDLYKKGLDGLKRQILTILNHEFRTPLTFVVAYADMLSNPGEHKMSDSELQSYLTGVSAGANRLRRLIENFILLVEMITGDAQQTYAWRRGDIDSINDLLAMAQEKAGQLDNHALTIEVTGAIPVFNGDMEYLAAALAQFLTNAAKFSADGKPIVMGAETGTDDVVLWVRDQGRGIPPNEYDAIWQPFYQINRAVNEDQGAGTGLAIVQGVAALHGGRAELDSKVGIGSTFRIVLPLRSRHA